MLSGANFFPIKQKEVEGIEWIFDGVGEVEKVEKIMQVVQEVSFYRATSKLINIFG